MTEEQGRAPLQWTHRYPILDEVQDFEGNWWYVHEIRGTDYDFDLLFGTRVSPSGLKPMGLSCLIATRPLVEFWKANSTQYWGMLYDLPAGRGALMRLRRRLGFRRLDALAKFWQDHEEDLKALSPREFAIRHKVGIDTAKVARRKLLGSQRRPLGWWQEPETLKILQSQMTRIEMGKKLGISPRQAGELRKRAREIRDESVGENGARSAEDKRELM